MKKSRSTRMKKPRSQELKKYKKEAKKYKNEEAKNQELQEAKKNPNPTTRTTSNTSQSSIPPYSTNPSQLLPSLYNSSRTFEPIQTFYNF